MGRRTLLLIASIIVAAVGTGVVALYVNTAQERAIKSGSPRQALYAAADIPAGASAEVVVKNAEIRKVSRNGLAADFLPPNTVLTGKTTVRAIKVGDPLTQSMFVDPAAASDLNPLGLGDARLGVSINVTDVARVAGYAGPGAYVALYVTTGDPDQEGTSAIHLLLPKPVRVIKVTAAATEKIGPTADQTLVTLDLDQTEAARVILASQTARIYLALVKDKKATLVGDPTVREPEIAPTKSAGNSGSGN